MQRLTAAFVALYFFISPPSVWAAAWNNPPASLPVGVQHGTFFSPSAGADVGYNIYLPPGYAGSQQTYPVIYHLHGKGGDENSEVSIASILDTNVQNGTLPPAIMVFPNGHDDSFYANSFDGSVPVETTIINELIPYIDQTYRTQSNRIGRAIEGFSMGGQGALLYASKYPNLFVSCVGYAGGYRTWDSLLQAYPSTAAGMFNNNELNYTQYSNWTWSNANAATVRTTVKLKMVIGTADFLYSNNIDFVTNLAQLNTPVEYVVVNGADHDLATYYDATGLDGFKFHAASFQQMATPVFSGSLTATAQTGAPLSYPLSASGSPASFTATGLPAGLSVDATTGDISGSTTATGLSLVNVAATNAADTGYATLLITVNAVTPSVPVVTSPTLVTGSEGLPLTYQITATNAPTTFSASGFPAGFSFNAESGVISGTPNTAGTYSINLVAGNAAGTAVGTLTLVISAGLEIVSAASAEPPLVTPGQSTVLSVAAAASDGSSPLYSWDFGDGISAAGNNVSHVYAAAGAYTATVRIDDNSGAIVSSSVRIEVANPLQVVSLKLSVDLQQPGDDAVSIIFDFPKGTGEPRPAGLTINIDVGGASANFTLNSNGYARTAQGFCALKFNRGKEIWSATAVLRNGDWARGVWSSGGLDVTQKVQSLSMPVTVTMNGQVFRSVRTLRYVGWPGKKGWGR